MVCLSIRVSSSVLSISVLQVSGYGSLASLDTRLIPRHFIIFVAGLNGTVSLISLSDLSLLVCRYARDFCVSLLYMHLTAFIDELQEVSGSCRRILCV